MTADAIFYGALKNIPGVTVWPDLAPAGTVAPWITYSAVGGQAFNTVDGATPSLRNVRMQVSVFAKTRPLASALQEQVFQALANPTVQAVPIGAPISTYETDTLLFSSSLDFSLNYKP